MFGASLDIQRVASGGDLRLCLCLCLCMFAIVACEGTGNPAQDACTPGSVRACTGDEGCAGEAYCGGSPAFWGGCDCLAQPMIDASVPGDGGAPLLPALGGACQTLDDCATGAFCLVPGSEALFGGGPPQGVCVADCSMDADACERYAAAVCVDVERVRDVDGGLPDAGHSDHDAGNMADSPTALCFERCKLGVTLGGAAKCHGLSHVACDGLDKGVDNGFCRPLCTRDVDCASGACDLRHGVCLLSASSSTPPEDHFGVACEPASEAVGTGACGGLCLSLTEHYSVCSHRCVFGEAGSCAPVSGTAGEGGCLFSSPGGSLGDVGFCAELCDCNDDCFAPDAVCDPFEDAALETTFGRKGVCTSPDLTLNVPKLCMHE